MIEEELKNNIKNRIKFLEDSIKELVKELKSKKTLTEKSILKTAECIKFDRQMIYQYRSILEEFFY